MLPSVIRGCFFLRCLTRWLGRRALDFQEALNLTEAVDRLVMLAHDLKEVTLIFPYFRFVLVSLEQIQVGIQELQGNCGLIVMTEQVRETEQLIQQHRFLIIRPFHLKNFVGLPCGFGELPFFDQDYDDVMLSRGNVPGFAEIVILCRQARDRRFESKNQKCNYKDLSTKPSAAGLHFCSARNGLE